MLKKTKPEQTPVEPKKPIPKKPRKRREPEPGPVFLLSKAQAARALSLSERSVEYLLAEGKLRKVNYGTAVRITVESVKKFAEGQS